MLLIIIIVVVIFIITIIITIQALAFPLKPHIPFAHYYGDDNGLQYTASVYCSCSGDGDEETVMTC